MAAALQLAYKAIAGQQLVSVDEPMIVPSPEAKFQLGDLPMRLLAEAAATTTSFQHLFEIIHEVTIPDPDDALIKCMGPGNAIEELAIPVDNPKASIAIYLIPIQADQYVVIKHYNLDKRVSASRFCCTPKGEAWGLDGERMSKYKRVTSHVLHYLLGHLGGYCLVSKMLSTPDVEKKLISETEIDAGFDYIQTNAPLSNINNALARWIMKQKNNPESPVFLWTEGKIREAAQNIISAKSLARMVEDYPLTLRDIKNWVLLNILPVCIRHSGQKAIYLAGAKTM